jgi:ABC-2 type transport system permease protein
MKAENFVPAFLFKFYGYLKKDLMLMYKRRNYLSVFILLPLIIAGLFLFAMQPSNYSIDVGVCNNDLGDLSSAVFEIDNFNPIFLDKQNCTQNLISSIESGEFPLGIVISPGFSKNVENLKQSKIDIYYDNTDVSFAGLISWKLDSALRPLKTAIIDEINSELNSKSKITREGVDIFGEKLNLDFNEGKLRELDIALKNVEELETEFLVDPVYVSHNPLYGGDVGAGAGIVFVVPVIILFVVLMLASTSVIYDKKTGFITRVRSSTTIFNYLLAKLTFFVFLVLVQFVIILLLFLASGNSYAFNFVGIIGLVFSIAIVDALLGLSIGLIAENEGIAVLFSLIISFPLMLISGIFFPIQTLPRVVQWVAGIMPLEFQIRAVRSVLLFGEGIGQSWLWLSGGLLIIVFWLFRNKT